MDYSIESNRLLGARYLHSPNQSERSPATEVELLVIHNISLPPGEFGSQCVEQLFCNTLDQEQHPYFREIAHLHVSSHLYIDRHGAVVQFVPFDRKAWHAGESSFCGRANCNDFSIGIELEGTDHEPFTDAQYDVLARVSAELLLEFPRLILDRIVGHSDIAPGRKTDPGPCFDWIRYRTALHSSIQRQADRKK